MIAGDGCAASRRSGSSGSSPFGVHADDLGAVAARHLAHPLAEDPVDPDDDGIAGPHEVHEGRLHPRRTGAADRQGQRVRGGEDLAEAVVRAVEQLQELGIEVPEHRPGQRHGHFRVRIRGPRSHEQAVGYPHGRIVAGPRSPAPTRRGPIWCPVDCPRGTGALRPEDAAAPPPERGRGSRPLRRLGSRARGRPVLHRDTSDEATDAPRGHGHRRGAARRRRLIRSDRWACRSAPAGDSLSSATVPGNVTSRLCWPSRASAGSSVSRCADEASTFEELLATTAASGGSDMALIFPGDIWARDTVTQLADALNGDGVAYADEDCLDDNGTHVAPRLKPAFSPEFLLHVDYIGRPLAISGRVVSRLPAASAGVPQAREHDLALRACEVAGSVRHIPEVLCHRRIPPSPVPTDAPNGSDHVAAALARRGERATVVSGAVAGTVRVHRTPGRVTSATIIIPFRDEPRFLRTCIESIDRTRGVVVPEFLLVDNGSVQARDDDVARTPGATIRRPSAARRPAVQLGRVEQCGGGVGDGRRARLLEQRHRGLHQRLARRARAARPNAPTWARSVPGCSIRTADSNTAAWSSASAGLPDTSSWDSPRAHPAISPWR